MSRPYAPLAVMGTDYRKCIECGARHVERQRRHRAGASPYQIAADLLDAGLAKKKPVVRVPVGALPRPRLADAANAKVKRYAQEKVYERAPVVLVLLKKRDGHRLRIIDGKHRIAAAIEAGATTIPAEVWE